ncbi:MAG: MBL fold metallo-hydrolase [Pseudohongiellaceae bacterium]
MATVTFFGAAREVTGSCHLLETESSARILLDCGMHQGGDAVSRLRKDNFPFKPSKIDAVVLSHAHLDHSGLLPKLVHQGFNGPVYCTAATAGLLEIMLNDSAGLYEKDLERENLRRRREDRRLVKPEYVRADVNRVIELCVKQSYRKPFFLEDGTEVCFHDAGHILGSAIVEVHLKDNERRRTLVFSGDLGKPGSILMNDPANLHKADLVMMESTYGDRNHRPQDNTIEQLTQILSNTWKQGGNILIPSFAVGRAQELIMHLGYLHHEGKLDDWQVFLDSPMAIEVTRVYDRWRHLLDGDDVRQLNSTLRASLEAFLPTLKLCVTPEESMAINQIKHGCIVIAGSGMCTGGRIRQHFKHRIWNPDNTIIFVGFQARGTLGRLLVDGVKRIRLFGSQFAVKARIETLGGFSAHAGQSDLVNWITRFRGNPKIALVHGEFKAMETLAAKLKTEHGLECLMPETGEKIEI